MTITRSQLETELVSRAKAYMQAVGFAVSVEGANADLNGPIAYAIRKSGGEVANPSLVANTDLSGFDADAFDQLADMAEYRLLLNVKRNWAKVDIKVGPRSESLSQLADQIQKDIDAAKEHIEDTYGGGDSSLSVGVVDMNFQATTECEED